MAGQARGAQVSSWKGPCHHWEHCLQSPLLAQSAAQQGQQARGHEWCFRSLKETFMGNHSNCSPRVEQSSNSG